MHQSRTDTASIAQAPKWHLTSERMFVKNRVGFNLYKGLSEFWVRFWFPKKSPAQFTFGFGSTELRPHWAEIGKNRPTGLSRSKGMETKTLGIVAYFFCGRKGFPGQRAGGIFHRVGLLDEKIQEFQTSGPSFGSYALRKL